MTKTDMPTKDCLAEMKRCSKCKRLKDKSEFHKLGKNSTKLQSWCMKCNHASMTAYRQRIKDEKLAEEKAAEKRLKAERREVLIAPAYKYKNEYTTFIVEPLHRQGTGVHFKAQIINNANEDEVMGIETPVMRMEWFNDWLTIKLKEMK